MISSIVFQKDTEITKKIYKVNTYCRLYTMPKLLERMDKGDSFNQKELIDNDIYALKLILKQMSDMCEPRVKELKEYPFTYYYDIISDLELKTLGEVITKWA
jgi:uncharacterized protein YutE (UPF0331/DUF86 family)